MKKNTFLYSGYFRQIPRIGVLVLAASLVACSDDTADLRQYVDATKQKYQGSVEPLPQFEPYQNYIYKAFTQRDPFLEKSEEPPEKNTGDSTQPDTDRRKEPLEFFPIDALKMVGTLEQKGQMWGLIRDPDGTIHRVQPGNHAGENYGEITRITENKIQMIEIIPDGLGAWIEREISLSIGEE